MFTGIISEIGTITKITGSTELTRFTIHAPATVGDLAVGDSIAINGACHTAVAVSADFFETESMPETLRRTNLGNLEIGSRVNLERPTIVGGRLDGHIVTGHIDGLAEIISLTPDGDATRMTLRIPTSLARLVVEKGSVTLDGVSLTVAGIDGDLLTVALIPHTLSTTTLGQRTLGERVNFEADILAKHVEKLTRQSGSS